MGSWELLSDWDIPRLLQPGSTANALIREISIKGMQSSTFPDSGETK